MFPSTIGPLACVSRDFGESLAIPSELARKLEIETGIEGQEFVEIRAASGLTYCADVRKRDAPTRRSPNHIA